MDPLDPFRAAAADPGRYARNWRAESRSPVIGFLCSYTPEEILVAGGCLPYRVFGAAGPLSHADGHFPSFSCSLARGVLADALDGSLDFLDGAVFPHTCDTIQRLSDIWRMNTRFKFHADVVLPVKMDTDSARAYMIDVVRTFKARLQDHLGRVITDDDLAEAVDIANRVRGGLDQVYRIRSANPAALDGGDLHAVLKACMVMDRGTLPGLLDAVLDRMAAAETGPALPRIVISGGLCGMPDVYRLVAQAGGAVVWDDLCTGWRHFAGEVETGGDPVEAIALRYLRRGVCPAKHAGLQSRADRLIDLVQRTRADGVIFLFLKFCDPHAFDLPVLKAALDHAGVPSLVLEIEDPVQAEGQMRTRCEAFMEML